VIDESNHVSYSFSFFLHGASRVCTSVDIKLHRPIRLLNNADLIKLKYKMRQYLEYRATTTAKNAKNNSSSKNSKNTKAAKKARIHRFKGISVILGPYGVAAQLIGYLANDCVESRLTCNEWSEFYPLKLNPALPNTLVVGLDKNRIKLFYPNSFVFVVMDSDNDDGHSNELFYANNLHSEHFKVGIISKLS
jgi:hypothetical protein